MFFYLINYDSTHSNYFTETTQYDHEAYKMLNFQIDVLSSPNSKIQYKYTLTGDDGDVLIPPTLMTSNRFSIKNLDPGRYTLEVFATNSTGQLVSSRSHLIHVVPHYWQRLWFKCLVGILCILGIFGLSFFTIRYLNLRKMKRLIKNNRELTLQNNLQLSRLKPHFIFNAFIPIQNLLIKDKKIEALTYIDAFSKLLRQSMSAIEKAFIPFDMELVFCQNYLAIQQEKMGEDTLIEFSMPHIDKPESFEIPSMFLQPLLENAFNYSKAKPLTIYATFDTTLTPNYIHITISNKGSMFPPHFEPQPDRGLGILTHRVQLFRDLYPLSSIWFFNNNGRATVHLILPIKMVD